MRQGDAIKDGVYRRQTVNKIFCKHQAVIEGLQDQTNRDADKIPIEYYDKVQEAYVSARRCSVCQESYSGNRTPHVLDCGHGVCTSCLDRLIIPPARPEQHHQLRCPVCRVAVYAYPARNRAVFAMMPGALPIPPRDLEI